MKVRDIMTKAPAFCHPDSNLAAAAEKMWSHDCGILPVVDDELGVVGVITDRDICIALGTKDRRASSVSVREVMTPKVHICAPEDDIHIALKVMEKGRVRRLPVTNRDGKLMGILSMDDIVLVAEVRVGPKIPELACEEVVEAYKEIRVRPFPAVPA
jgi:CBS domain-containing protein